MQGQQTYQEQKPKKRNAKIAVISLTTKEIDNKANHDDSEPQEDEPDEHAHPQMPVAGQKRISHKRMALQINSPNGKSKDVMSDY
jgi:hypothetical protein